MKDVGRVIAVVALAGVTFSIWIGVQIGITRDPIAWLFLLVLPLMIISGLGFALRSGNLSSLQNAELSKMRADIENLQKRLRQVEIKCEAATKSREEE